MIRRIDCNQVKAGMYVHGFGGSWFKHPFWTSKFLLETAEDVAKVRGSEIPYVLIDDALGVAPDAPTGTISPGAIPPQRSTSPLPQMRAAPHSIDAFSEEKRASDRQQATKLVQRSKKVIQGIFDCARLGRAVRVAEVIHIVDEVSESVARSPHAL
ncbi:MAG: DUF3391 domain-containing protein, partial [Sphingobium sp.]